MRKIQAHFENMSEARKATAALADAGFGKAHLDLAGPLDYEFWQELNHNNAATPAADGTDDLSTILIRLWAKGLYDKDTFTDPGIQSQRARCEEGELKISTCLWIKVQDQTHDAVSKIIRAHGGRIFSSFME